MAEQEGPTPRRALPPRDDVPDVDDVADDLESTAFRRGLWSPASDGGGASGSTPGTPIPPPAVLPASDVAPASAGRRFSAVDLPTDESRPLPRRSALSPAATRTRSPRTPDAVPTGSSTPTGSSKQATPPSRAPRRSLPGEPGGPPRPRQGRRGPVIGIIVAVVLALLAATVWYLTGPGAGPGRPAPSPTPTIDPAATYLLQADDLAGVRPNTTWAVATTATTLGASTPKPLCVTPVPELEKQPAGVLVRTFSPTSGEPGGLLHQVEVYPTPEDATAAYTERLTQLGSCERNTAWLEGGFTVSGLGDESAGAGVVLQADQPEYHAIIVSRTGTRVNVVDATQASGIPDPAASIGALTAVFTRQCGDGGTCPSASPSVGRGVPPAVEPFGFLAGVDLPRITASAGEWRGTPVAAGVTTTGTRCEGVDLTQAPGASQQQQRTLLLQDDAAAPGGFGVDEVVYTFNTPEEAAGFVGTLVGGIDGCAARTATAEVAKTGDLTGPGAGAAWAVSRQVDQAATRARYRVAALAAGNHAVYLMANPTAEFDFSDEAFHHVALRSAERLTQLP